jgi:hypothetical protein
LKTVSYEFIDLENFKGSDISRGEFSFYAEPLNTSSRRYSNIYKVSNLEPLRSPSYVSVDFLSRLGGLEIILNSLRSKDFTFAGL